MNRKITHTEMHVISAPMDRFYYKINLCLTHISRGVVLCSAVTNYSLAESNWKRFAA